MAQTDRSSEKNTAAIQIIGQVTVPVSICWQPAII